MSVRTLERKLRLVESSKDFFDLIFRFVKLDYRNAIVWKGQNPEIVVFFGSGFNPKLCEVILSSPASPKAFEPVQELRLIATLLDSALAKEIKNLNPTMRVFYLSKSEWRDRPVGGANPVIPTSTAMGVEI